MIPHRFLIAWFSLYMKKKYVMFHFIDIRQKSTNSCPVSRSLGVSRYWGDEEDFFSHAVGCLTKVSLHYSHDSDESLTLFLLFFLWPLLIAQGLPLASQSVQGMRLLPV